MTPQDHKCPKVFTNSPNADAMNRVLCGCVSVEEFRASVDPFRMLKGEIERLQANNARLREALEKATDLIDCIEQRSSDNCWWVNAYDSEQAVTETYSVVCSALTGEADNG